MRKSIDEYGRVLLVSIILVFLISFLFGNRWFSFIGKIADTTNPDKTVTLNLNKKAPTIIAGNQTIKVDESHSIWEWVHAQDGNGADLTKYIKITSNSEYYDANNKKFCVTDENGGVYKINFKITDPENDTLQTSKTIKIVADASLKQNSYSIRTINSNEGSFFTLSASGIYGETINFEAIPNSGYKYTGAILKSNGISKVLSADANSFVMPNSSITIEPKWEVSF